MHETVAECMIFANSWVAKRILETFPSCSLLRHHPPPSQDKFTTLRECAEARGFTVDTSSNKALAETLDNCVDPRDDSVNKVGRLSKLCPYLLSVEFRVVLFFSPTHTLQIMRTLATQAMSQAAYFSTGSIPPDQYEHYGLALKHYTHFTSPIRRYADLVVRRGRKGGGERNIFIGLTVCLSFYFSGASAAVGCCGGGGEGNTTWHHTTGGTDTAYEH